MEAWLAYGGWVAAILILAISLITAWRWTSAEDKRELDHARQIDGLRRELEFWKGAAQFEGLPKHLTRVWRQ